MKSYHANAKTKQIHQVQVRLSYWKGEILTFSLQSLNNKEEIKEKAADFQCIIRGLSTINILNTNSHLSNTKYVIILFFLQNMFLWRKENPINFVYFHTKLNWYFLTILVSMVSLFLHKRCMGLASQTLSVALHQKVNVWYK